MIATFTKKLATVTAAPLDARQQMLADLGNESSPVARNMMAQKYGLVPPVFTSDELNEIRKEQRFEEVA